VPHVAAVWHCQHRTSTNTPPPLLVSEQVTVQQKEHREVIVVAAASDIGLFWNFRVRVRLIRDTVYDRRRITMLDTYVVCKNRFLCIKHFVWRSTPVQVTDPMMGRTGSVLDIRGSGVDVKLSADAGWDLAGDDDVWRVQRPVAGQAVQWLRENVTTLLQQHRATVFAVRFILAVDAGCNCIWCERESIMMSL